MLQAAHLALLPAHAFSAGEQTCKTICTAIVDFILEPIFQFWYNSIGKDTYISRKWWWRAGSLTIATIPALMAVVAVPELVSDYYLVPKVVVAMFGVWMAVMLKKNFLKKIFG